MPSSATPARLAPPALLALLAAVLLTASASAQSVFINEIHYDNDGTDTGEFIEVAGPAGTDLTGWSLFLYTLNGSSYRDVALGETIPNQQNGFGTVSTSFPTNGIQNGPSDGVALVMPDGTVVQFLSYEGVLTATEGPADGMTSTDIGVRETGSTPAGESLQLIGSGTSYDDFAWAGPVEDSPGEVNDGQSFMGVVVDEFACVVGAPLSFDFDGDDASDGSDVMADDFDSTGSDATFGEFVGIRNEVESGPAINLTTCSFVAFDPFTEAVTYVLGTTETVDADAVSVLATMGGDQSFGQSDVLADNPGAFALIEGTATVGDDVSTVLGRVVAAVVYDRDRNVFGSVGGGATEASRVAFAQALASVGSGATAVEETPSEVVLGVAPNPISGAGRVLFTLPAAADLQVTLYDALGRQVAVLAEGMHGAGPHAAALPVSTLSAGIYVVRAVIGGEAQTTRVTVVR